MATKIGVIGLGNLGTAMLNVIGSNGHEVIAWEHNSDVVAELNTHHTNNTYLPDISLPTSAIATSDIHRVFAESSMVFITLPSKFTPSALAPLEPDLFADVPIVNMSKGIDVETGKTAMQTIQALRPAHSKAVLSGPSLANEFVAKKGTAVVAASSDQTLLQQMQYLLNNDYFKVASHPDMLGVELGGILKNIYALSFGIMLTDIRQNLNFTGLFITQALKEMATLSQAMGAEASTVYQLSGIGDLICTALSPHSHNRKLGKLFAQGYTVAEAETHMGILPESFNTLKAIMPVIKEQQLELPIAQALYDGLSGHGSTQALYQDLMNAI
jgi:glycerol-3-phosphate dehydrogenase (NAD(P)+)